MEGDELVSTVNASRWIGSAVDVGDAATLTDWVNSSFTALGGIDGVVANVSALAIPESTENWHTSFDVDLMGTVDLMEAALPHLLASGAGSVVAISSVSGREIDFAAGPYGTRKQPSSTTHRGWPTSSPGKVCGRTR